MGVGQIILSLLVGCSAQAQETTLAFVHVNVIPMTSKKVLRNQTVLIIDDKIKKLGVFGSIRIPEAATVIDGSGKFLIPGLTDAHSHIAYDTPSSFHENELLLLLANGVTTIRNLAGTKRHKELQQLIAENKILGPRIFSTGPWNNDRLNANKGQAFDSLCNDWGCFVRTPKGAIEVVHAQKADGYDTLKITETLNRPTALTLLTEAKNLGLDVVGHVSKTISIEEVLTNNYMRSIEHLRGYPEYAENPDSPFLDIPDTYRGPDNFYGLLGLRLLFSDWNKIQQVVKLTAKHGVFNVPTLTVTAHFAQEVRALDPKIIAGKGFDYMEPCWAKMWVDLIKDYPQEYGNWLNYKGRDLLAEGAQANLKLVKLLSNAGATLVAGTDHNVDFVVPGFSMHEELQLLVKAGLTPFKALETATVNAAKLLKQANLGSIEAGKYADLVLLNKNPLKDIRASQDIHGVMVRGQWVDHAQIQKWLQKVKTDTRAPVTCQ